MPFYGTPSTIQCWRQDPGQDGSWPCSSMEKTIDVPIGTHISTIPLHTGLWQSEFPSSFHPGMGRRNWCQYATRDRRVQFCMPCTQSYHWEIWSTLTDTLVMCCHEQIDLWPGVWKNSSPLDTPHFCGAHLIRHVLCSLSLFTGQIFSWCEWHSPIDFNGAEPIYSSWRSGSIHVIVPPEPMQSAVGGEKEMKGLMTWCSMLGAELTRADAKGEGRSDFSIF